MRRVVIVVLASLFAVPAFAQTGFHFDGFLTMREVKATAPESWIQGGQGKFDVSGNHTVPLQEAQLGIDWTPITWLTFHTDGLWRNKLTAGEGKQFGLVQAYADVGTEKFRVRAGQFWLTTSRENVDPLWNSRYTITYSALNSWIAQEVRPMGADVQWSPSFYITVGGTAFRGNETMGTLLANHGWTLGKRLTVFDEKLPTPTSQTQPFSTDFGSGTGFSGRLRLQLPERALLQLTHVDNGAEIYPATPPKVPWRTKYDTIGTTIGLTTPVSFVAEWMRGSTEVAVPHRNFRVHMDTYYALVSYLYQNERVSARYERFKTDLEKGDATTFAWFHEFKGTSRFGAEYVHSNVTNGGKTITLELRIGF